MEKVQLLCAVGWAYSMSRILKSHCALHNVPIEHSIDRIDIENLAKEFLTVEAPEEVLDLRKYYMEISKAETHLTMTPTDRPILDNIRYLHSTLFAFPSYVYLRSFINRHAGIALA